MCLQLADGSQRQSLLLGTLLEVCSRLRAHRHQQATTGLWITQQLPLAITQGNQFVAIGGKVALGAARDATGRQVFIDGGQQGNGVQIDAGFVFRLDS